MQRVECEFESDVLAAVIQSRWPERVDPQLRAHAAECAICSDVAAVAGVIDSARDEMRMQAMLPDSGRVWWHAQMRARREAAKAAARPITATQMIAGACAVGLAGRMLRRNFRVVPGCTCGRFSPDLIRPRCSPSTACWLWRWRPYSSLCPPPHGSPPAEINGPN